MTQPQAAAEQTAPLTWGLCVATLNRIDILETCVACALGQTRPPSEVVIVDASDAWEAHRARIARLTDAASTPLTYLPAARRSLAVQRNQGIAAASADILFLIDDDSLLYPDAAEIAMALYEAPFGRDVVAVGLKSKDAPPPALPSIRSERAASTSAGRAALGLKRTRVFGWLYREVFLLTHDRLFFEYTPGRPRPSAAAEPFPPAEVAGAYLVKFIGGYYLTARRSVALAEPFNRHLLGYSPMEDLDAVYRWQRHGRIAQSTRAGVHHHVSSQSRIDRRKVTQLQLSNMALFVRMNSVKLATDSLGLSIRMLRRLVAEFLKDAGTRRLTFPQLRGALAAVPATHRVLTMPAAEIPDWYERYQSLLIWGRPAPPPTSERPQQHGGD